MKKEVIREEMEKAFTIAYCELIARLSNPEIIQLAACNAGLAYFPEVGKAFFSSKWAEGHGSSRVDHSWVREWGPAVMGLQILPTPANCCDLDFEKMQLTPANDVDAYETTFAEKMADPAWVVEVAAALRADMLSPGFIRDEVAMAVDRWTEYLDQLASSEV